MILGKHVIPNKSIEKIIAALGDEDWHIRAAAVPAIIKASYKTESSPDIAIPYLRSTLEDKDWRVRLTAAACLASSTQSRKEEIIVSLAPAFQDEDWRVRLIAIRALSYPGQTTPVLVELLHDKYQDIRLAAAIKLLEFGVESELAESILINALRHHQDARIRHEALWALRKGLSGASVAAVIAALQDDDTKIRELAARILGRISGGSGGKAVPALINALQDKNKHVRLEAIESLGRGIGSPTIIHALTATLDDADQDVRNAAKYFLSQSKSAIQEAINNLHNNDWQVRRSAAEKLGMSDFKKERAPAEMSDLFVSILLKSLRDPNPDVRASVAATLVNLYRDLFVKAADVKAQLPPAVAIALKQAVPNLIASLKNGDAQARLDTISVLGVLGADAKAAISVLRDTLADENWLFRYVAAVALLQINPLETAVVPVLAEIFRDPIRAELLGIDDPDIAEAHEELWALGKIGSAESINVLINLLQVSDEKNRYSLYPDDAQARPLSSDILIESGPKVIPALITGLKNENIRFIAADTLGQMGLEAISSFSGNSPDKGQDGTCLKRNLRGQRC